MKSEMENDIVMREESSKEWWWNEKWKGKCNCYERIKRIKKTMMN
jgi:hypothetical protein